MTVTCSVAIRSKRLKCRFISLNLLNIKWLLSKPGLSLHLLAVENWLRRDLLEIWLVNVFQDKFK